MNLSVKSLAVLSVVTAAVIISSGGKVLAHVTVKPAEVAVSGFQTFTVSVPNEKSIANTSVKLIVPTGLKHVTPSVKQGWNIATETTGEGEAAVVSAITWSGGSIGAGFRDDFTFSAQVPSEAATLEWKAYQTYADGVTVAWDKTADEQPKKADGSHDFSTSGPFSVTKVVAETAAESAAQSSQQEAYDALDTARRAQSIAIAALSIAVISGVIALRSMRSKP